MNPLTSCGKPAVQLLALFLAACSSTQRGGPNHPVASDVPPAPEAWWLERKFEPSQQEVEGFAVTDFDVRWQSAAALDSKRLQQRLSAREFEEHQASGQQLALAQDLNSNGTPERLFVGVYEDTRGERGRFLAVVEADELVKVFQHPGPTTYSGLMPRENAVRWYKCMLCDNFDTISWNGSDYILEYRQHTDVPIP